VEAEVTQIVWEVVKNGKAREWGEQRLKGDKNIYIEKILKIRIIIVFHSTWGSKLTFLRSDTISKPAITAVPLVGDRSPVNTRKAVVFPAPAAINNKLLSYVRLTISSVFLTIDS